MSIYGNLAASAAMAISMAIATPSVSQAAIPANSELQEGTVSTQVAGVYPSKKCEFLEICDDSYRAATMPISDETAIIGPCGCTEFDRCKDGPPWVVAGRVYIEADIHSGHLSTEGGGRVGVEWTF